MKGFNLIHKGYGAGLLGMSRGVHTAKAVTASKQQLSFLSMIQAVGTHEATKVPARAVTSALLGGGNQATGTRSLMTGPPHRALSFGNNGAETKEVSGRHSMMRRSGVSTAESDNIPATVGEALTRRHEGVSGDTHTADKSAGEMRRAALFGGSGTNDRPPSDLSRPAGPDMKEGETPTGKGGADKHYPAAVKGVTKEGVFTEQKAVKGVATLPKDGGGTTDCRTPHTSRPAGPDMNQGVPTGKGGADKHSPAAVKDVTKEGVFTEQKAVKGVATLPKDGGTAAMEEVPKHPSPKGETVRAGHDGRGVTQPSGHRNGGHHRGLSPSHRVDGNAPLGEYHHASSDSVRGPAVIQGGTADPVVKPQALISRIVTGVKGPGRVRIVLSPPHLGTVDVDVLVRSQSVHVVMQAEHSDVRQVLLSHMDSLRNALQGQGLTVDSIDVSLHERTDRGYSETGRNETWLSDRGDGKGNRNGEKGGREPSKGTLSPAHEGESFLRSDGFISLFV